MTQKKKDASRDSKSRGRLTDLADALSQFVPPPSKRSWFDKLSDQKRRERLLEVRRRFHAGKYSAVGVGQIFQFCKDAEKLTIGIKVFTDWLYKRDD